MVGCLWKLCKGTVHVMKVCGGVEVQLLNLNVGTRCR
jgi:hypothetical protein